MARTLTGLRLLALAVVCVAVLPACRQQMADEGRLRPYEPSPAFDDGRSARPRVPGTVARNEVPAGTPFATGRTADGGHVATLPFPLTREVLERGRGRFDIYCAPCHGRLGTGDGMVAQRGFRRPPSYHIERLQQVPLGHFFEVMTKGQGAMPDYSAQIPHADRWAIAAYIRALQISQAGRLDDVPPAERERLQAQADAGAAPEAAPLGRERQPGQVQGK
jgi:mono/diheme cytochrome c family protein